MLAPRRAFCMIRRQPARPKRPRDWATSGVPVNSGWGRRPWGAFISPTIRDNAGIGHPHFAARDRYEVGRKTHYRGHRDKRDHYERRPRESRLHSFPTSSLSELEFEFCVYDVLHANDASTLFQPSWAIVFPLFTLSTGGHFSEPRPCYAPFRLRRHRYTGQQWFIFGELSG